jgi:uncharacterized protein DUF4394
MRSHHRLSAALRGCSSLRPRRVAGIFAALVASAILVQPVSGELIYGIANQAPATALVTFDSASPGALLTGVFLTGLQQNETILGIDFRPATGQLFGLGSTSRLYTINPATGASVAVGGQFAPTLNGFSFGFDFNPVIDRIRVVSETNQNLVLDPNTGVVQTVAPNVAYAAADPNFGVDPNIVDSAYTNNFPGAVATTLYGIDTGLDILATQVAATGVLSTVGPLGLNVAAAGGFDVSGTTGIAYAALLPVAGSQSSLYSINLATGAATNLGVIDGGLVLTALTTAPIPEPASAGLLLLGLAGAYLVRRRTR